MKLPYTVILLCILFGCSKPQHTNMKLTLLSDSTRYISITDSGILLPTIHHLPDSIYISDEDILADKDIIFEIFDTKDTIQLKGDTIYHKGDTIRARRTTETYDTEISLKDDGIYIYSTSMLTVCQINLSYKDIAIFNKTLNRYSDRSNKSLDFLRKEKDRYVYYAPYDTWESGGYDSFNYMLIIYKPLLESYEGTSTEDNEITIGKKDFDKYFEKFKAHLILR